MYCDNCGEENFGNVKICHKCGSVLHKEGEYVNKLKKVAPPEPKMIYCSSCGKQNFDYASVCVGCGNPLNHIETRKVYCSSCGKENSINSTCCFNCGTPLSNNFQGYSHNQFNTNLLSADFLMQQLLGYVGAALGLIALFLPFITASSYRETETATLSELIDLMSKANILIKLNYIVPICGGIAAYKKAWFGQIFLGVVDIWFYSWISKAIKAESLYYSAELSSGATMLMISGCLFIVSGVLCYVSRKNGRARR